MTYSRLGHQNSVVRLQCLSLVPSSCLPLRSCPVTGHRPSHLDKQASILELRRMYWHVYPSIYYLWQQSGSSTRILIISFIRPKQMTTQRKSVILRATGGREKKSKHWPRPHFDRLRWYLRRVSHVILLCSAPKVSVSNITVHHLPNTPSLKLTGNSTCPTGLNTKNATANLDTNRP